MSVHTKIWLTLFVCSLTVAGRRELTAEEASSSWKSTATAEGVAVSEGERPVLFYQRAPKSIDGRYERAGYVHPLYDMDGGVLTEDFPKDHLHQRGIYWAWHQVWIGEQRIGDPWEMRDFSWDVGDVDVAKESAGTLAIRAEVLWKSPLWRDAEGKLRPVVRETSQIRIHRASEAARKIDFQIELLALHENLRIGGSEDDKGYGGFSARVRLPRGVQFIGQQGVVEPQLNAVAAGPSLDIAARFSDAGISGLTILCHPSLPGFPQPWVLRSSGSMQNPAWPGRNAVVLPHDKPLVLRYRLVVHRGSVSPETLASWQSEYASEVK